LVELSAPSNYLFPDHSTVFHGYPCKYSRSSLIWRRIVSSLEVLQKGMQECLFIELWCVLTFCLLPHQLLQPWRLLIHCGQVLHNPCWRKLKRLQRKWKGTWLLLYQQLKEISKWNTPVISCAAQI
jgi:hypothetical protein